MTQTWRVLRQPRAYPDQPWQLVAGCLDSLQEANDLRETITDEHDVARVEAEATPCPACVAREVR